jgi:hypothetical protein
MAPGEEGADYGGVSPTPSLCCWSNSRPRTGQTERVVRQHILDGTISAAGFASGDRLVVGSWEDSPIGPFLDIMWAEPDNWRTLLVPHERAGAFVSALYEFDSLIVDPALKRTVDGRTISISWTNAQVEFEVGRSVPFPPRPNWVTRRVEKPLARAALSVETHGMTPSGIEETYKARRLRRIVDGWAVVAGRDLGQLGPPTPACGFGFSEPPPFASVADVSPILTDHEGRLDALLGTTSVEESQ